MGNTKSANANEKEKDKEYASDASTASDPIKAAEKEKKREQVDLKKKKKDDEKNRSSGSLAGSKDKQVMPAGQRDILRFSMTNAKEDLGQRIIMRVADKREDFRTYLDTIGKEEKREQADRLRDFIGKIVENSADPEEMDQLSRKFGEQYVNMRAAGFRPDFFVGMADAMTTECVFLDGATHGATDTLMAWSVVTSQVFSAVRDGYYNEMRRLRRISNANSAQRESLAVEDSPSVQRDPRLAKEAKDFQAERRESGSSPVNFREDDRASSKSGDEVSSAGEELNNQVPPPPPPAPPAQFLAPPASY